MNHLEVRKKYSAAPSIFNFLLVMKHFVSCLIYYLKHPNFSSRNPLVETSPKRPPLKNMFLSFETFLRFFFSTIWNAGHKDFARKQNNLILDSSQSRWFSEFLLTIIVVPSFHPCSNAYFQKYPKTKFRKKGQLYILAKKWYTIKKKNF